MLRNLHWFLEREPLQLFFTGPMDRLWCFYHVTVWMMSSALLLLSRSMVRPRALALCTLEKWLLCSKYCGHRITKIKQIKIPTNICNLEQLCVLCPKIEHRKYQGLSVICDTYLSVTHNLSCVHDLIFESILGRQLLIKYWLYIEIM